MQVAESEELLIESLYHLNRIIHLITSGVRDNFCLHARESRVRLLHVTSLK